MKVDLTINDFPSNKANCATCTQKSTLFCVRNRRSKTFGNRAGYVKNDSTGSYDGVIYRCPNYQGPFQTA